MGLNSGWPIEEVRSNLFDGVTDMALEVAERRSGRPESPRQVQGDARTQSATLHRWVF